MRLWSSWLGFCTVTAEIAGSSPVSRAKHVPVAQLVEHWIEDPGVGGSNPSECTKPWFGSTPNHFAKESGSVTPPCRTRLVDENSFIVFLNKSPTWIN